MVPTRKARDARPVCHPRTEVHPGNINELL
jgi:hypothetical protein